MDAAIAENGAVWAKGNAGEALDPAERVAYQALLTSLNDWFFQTRLVLQEIAPHEEIQMFVLFAGFLSENPGAYATWLERERRLNADRASLIAVPDPEDVTGNWVEKVQSSIDAIRRNNTN